jgi:RNA polymerase sigma factor (TIGR02999 family)
LDLSPFDFPRILDAIDGGDAGAAEQSLPLVYGELRRLAAQRLAREKPGQTFQPTALVHEVYLRLVGAEREQRWESRGHFFADAAQAMRRILVENARRRKRDKRGGGLQRVNVELDAFERESDAVDAARSPGTRA